MTVTIVTQHCKPTFMPLALLCLKASLVERGGIPPSTSVFRVPLTFADLADKWVAWDHSDDAVTDRDRVEQFVARVCDEAEIPPDFYRHVIRLAADPPRAQRPPLP